MSDMAICASVRDGVAVVNTFAGRTLAFLGASCPASAIPGNDGLCSVTLSPNKGQDAVVALATYYNHNKKSQEIREGGLICLRWEGDKLFVDVDKPFISPADRLGQVVPFGRILQVTTRGQTFAMSTIEDQYRKMYEDPLKLRGARIVNDANLLCRYLVGQATFEELEAVASGDQRSAEKIQITDLYKRCRSLSNRCWLSENQSRREIEGKAAETISAQAGEIQELRAKLSRVTDQYRGAQQVAQDEISRWAKRYRDAEVMVLLQQDQLNATLGAKWRRFWEKVSIRR